MNSGTRVFPPMTSSPFSFEKKEEPAVQKDMPVQSAPANAPAPATTPMPVPAATAPAAPPPAPVHAPAQSSLPTEEEARKAVATLLRWIGEDPAREGLRHTPQAVAEGWKDIFHGYDADPKDFLKGAYARDGDTNDMVCLEKIPLTLWCEKTLEPVSACASVAYIPGLNMIAGDRIVALAEGYAARLQVQDRLARQIASALHDVLLTKGVAVCVRAARGKGGDTLAFCTLGVFETDAARRAEFLSLAGRAA